MGSKPRLDMKWRHVHCHFLTKTWRVSRAVQQVLRYGDRALTRGDRLQPPYGRSGTTRPARRSSTRATSAARTPSGDELLTQLPGGKPARDDVRGEPVDGAVRGVGVAAQHT